MVRAKEYMGVDVLTAAQNRIEHLYDTFDSVVVQFSGGKDSLSVLHLIKDFQDLHGLGNVQAIFRDEEVINPSVLDYVDTYRRLPWLDLRWYCLPLLNDRVVLDRKFEYLSWDPSREWAHPMPEWGIGAEDMGVPADAAMTQHGVDDLTAREFPGRVAYVTGVRADESLIRFRSVTQKLNLNWISSIEGNERSRVKLAKPIYDWSQMDVLKFLYDEDIGWCPVYDAQELAGIGLRVSTPLHAGSVKKFGALRAVEPEFYQRCVDIFPDMLVQERYGNDFDRDALLDTYLADGFDGIMRFINERMDGASMRSEAIKRASEWKKRWRKDPENYPLRLLLQTIAWGDTDKRLAGIYVNSKSARPKKKANNV